MHSRSSSGYATGKLASLEVHRSRRVSEIRCKYTVSIDICKSQIREDPSYSLKLYTKTRNEHLSLQPWEVVRKKRKSLYNEKSSFAYRLLTNV